MQTGARVDSRRDRFERMVTALAGDVYRYAFMLSRNEAQAEDLVQETFLRAWRFFDSLRDDSKAKSWLFTTVRREHARQFERYRPGFDEVDLDTLAGDGPPAPEVWELRRAVAALPLKYREVLVLQALGGYSGSEIAGMIGLPRATVNTRLFRARQILRRRLAGDSEADVSEISVP